MPASKGNPSQNYFAALLNLKLEDADSPRASSNVSREVEASASAKKAAPAAHAEE